MPDHTTVRFSKLVEISGQPEPYTLWQDPAKDGPFQTALREHRVLSVHQETAGSKADYGEVGYSTEQHGEILIFPKSLKLFEGKRIVGVKYDLLKKLPGEEKPMSRKQKPVIPPKPPRKLAPKAPPKPAPKPIEPEKVLQFPRAHVPPPVERKQEMEAFVRELKEIKQKVREAVKALSQDRSVTAYKILQKLV